MSLTAEQSAALTEDTLTSETTETAHDAPASGEQEVAEPVVEEAATTETTEGGTTEAEGENAEGKKPEPAKTEEPRTWKAVEAAKKAQVQASRARAQAEQRATQVQQHEQHLRTVAHQLQQREARVAKLESALQSNDLDTLLELGFDYEKATRKRLEEADPNARLARLERERAEEREEQRRARVTNEHVTETRNVMHTLVRIVDEGPEEFPELFTWPPERVANEGIAERDRIYAQTRRMPTYDQVLKVLSRRAKTEADAATERRTRLEQRKSPNASAAGSAGKAGQQGGSGSPNTPALSSSTAAIRATPPRQKTEAEIDEECLAELRGLKR